MGISMYLGHSPRARALAFEELLDDVGRPLVGADVDNRRNVGVIQRRRLARLLLETP